MSRTFSISKRVGRKLEGVGAMRLQTEGAPNPADRHAAEHGGLGQTARAPMRLCAWRTFQGPNHTLLHLSIGDLAGRSGPRFVIESFQASLQKSGTPLAHHAQRAAQFLRHALVRESLGAGQHHPRPPSQRRLAARAMGQRLKPLLLFLSQSQWPFGASGSHLSLLHLRRTSAQLSSLISVTGD